MGENVSSGASSQFKAETKMTGKIQKETTDLSWKCLLNIEGNRGPK